MNTFLHTSVTYQNITKYIYFHVETPSMIPQWLHFVKIELIFKWMVLNYRFLACFDHKWNEFVIICYSLDVCAKKWKKKMEITDRKQREHSRNNSGVQSFWICTVSSNPILTCKFFTLVSISLTQYQNIVLLLE